MDVFLGVIIVIAFLVLAVGPLLGRWLGPPLQRWAMGKWEDRMRRAMGMPTRKEEARARREAERRSDGAAGRFRSAAAGRRRVRVVRSTVYMLSSLAEDVEFIDLPEPWPVVVVKFKEERQIEDAVIIEERKTAQE